MAAIFGIDLGTTNSCIAIIDENGMPLVMKNLDDDFTTPSVVSFDDMDNALVGREGKNSMGSETMQTVAFIKREMSNPAYSREINGEKVNPVKISSMILKKLKDDANTLLEEEGKPKIKKAVITVPAYFGSLERENTKQAAELAGLEVLNLINEPTAAALSYGAKELSDKTFLIYDLGGGTFDVSVMQMKNGEMETLSSEGNHRLGGVDWDTAIVDYGLLQEGYDETYEDIENDPGSGKMIVAAEVCKKRLTENEDTTYKYIFRRKTHMVKVKRSLFEELTADLVQQTIDLMKKAIEMAKLKVGNPDLKLDEIILVGGSSHMPMIRKRILKEYPHINIRLDRFEPDLAIAKGAALYAAGNVKIEDMGTRSYGTSIRSAADKNKNVVVNIIYKTDPMVVEKSSTFYTAHPKQTSALIDVYENEGLDGEIELKKCKLLREDSLEWGYPVDAGTQIDMVLSRGTDGILKVFGKCEGKVVQFEIKADQALSRQEAQEWRERLDSQTF